MNHNNKKFIRVYWPTTPKASCPVADEAWLVGWRVQPLVYCVAASVPCSADLEVKTYLITN